MMLLTTTANTLGPLSLKILHQRLPMLTLALVNIRTLDRRAQRSTWTLKVSNLGR
jgi:hypothetical protein